MSHLPTLPRPFAACTHKIGMLIRVDAKIKVSSGVSTQLQSSGLVYHENSTFRNLALVVSEPFMV